MRTIGAHWYARPQTLKECTKQSLEFLIKLTVHNPILFGAWFEKGGSRKQALERKVEFSYDDVKRLFTKRGDDDVFPEMSYTFSVWNGAPNDEETAGLSVSLGSSEPRYFTNNCVIDIPFEGEQHEFYENEENQQALIDLLSSQWNPQWIVVEDKRL